MTVPITFIPKYRDDLPQLLLPEHQRIAVEVGVHQAVFASKFMESWAGEIHLIDPWESYGHDHPTFYPNFQPHTTDREQDFEIAVAIMAPYMGRCTFHRQYSFNAALTLPNCIDLVYIDGLHDYLSVKQDMNAWWNKLTPEGWLCGHDYHSDLPEVIKAVDEFVDTNNLQVFYTEDFMPSWMIPKTYKVV